MQKLLLAKNSELYVLGQIFLANQKVSNLVFDSLTADHFCSDGARELFTIALILRKQSISTDGSTIEDHLTRMGKQHLVTYLIEATEKAISRRLIDESPNHHISFLKLLAKARGLTDLCNATLHKFQNEDELAEVITSHQSQLLAIDSDSTTSTTVTANEATQSLLAQIEISAKSTGFVGVPTGFPKLNTLTGGFRGGEFIVFAARPGIGKSVYAVQLALANPYTPSCIVTLEMTSTEIIARMASHLSETPLNFIRSGKFPSEFDKDKALTVIQSLASSPVQFEDCPNLSISDLRAKIRKQHSDRKIEFAVVDYLQLVSGSKDSRSRNEEIGTISRGLKALAKELNIPIIALAQLKRSENESEEPALHHLRESGSIEQDADAVILLHRPKPSDSDRKSFQYQTLLKLAKQRNGPCNSFWTTLNAPICKFYESNPPPH